MNNIIYVSNDMIIKHGDSKIRIICAYYYMNIFGYFVSNIELLAVLFLIYLVCIDKHLMFSELKLTLIKYFNANLYSN